MGLLLTDSHVSRWGIGIYKSRLCSTEHSHLTTTWHYDFSHIEYNFWAKCTSALQAEVLKLMLCTAVGRLLTENEEQSICKSPFLIMTAQRTAHHEDAVVSSPLFGDDAWMDKSR